MILSGRKHFFLYSPFDIHLLYLPPHHPAGSPSKMLTYEPVSRSDVFSRLSFFNHTCDLEHSKRGGVDTTSSGSSSPTHPSLSQSPSPLTTASQAASVAATAPSAHLSFSSPPSSLSTCVVSSTPDFSCASLDSSTTPAFVTATHSVDANPAHTATSHEKLNPHDASTLCEACYHHTKFPLFLTAPCWYACLEAGDALYIPNGYLHEVLTPDLTTAVNLWFEAAPVSQFRPTILHLYNDGYAAFLKRKRVGETDNINPK